MPQIEEYLYRMSTTFNEQEARDIRLKQKAGLPAYGVRIINPRVRQSDPHRVMTVRFDAASEKDARKQAEEKCRQHGFRVGKAKLIIDRAESRKMQRSAP